MFRIEKPIRSLLIVLLALSGAKTPAAPQAPLKPERPGPHPTRLIAKLKDLPGGADRAAQLVSEHGLAVRKRFRHSPGLVLLDETAAQAQAFANATPQERKLKLLA